MTRLLLLDLNGFLVYKERDKEYECEYECITIPNFKLYIRPGAKEFVSKLLDTYDVAIYTSTTYTNVSKIIKVLFTKDQEQKLKFIWCRDRTLFDPDYGDDSSVEFFATVKNLDQIWRNPSVNYKRLYNKNNTIICDDDETKVRFNDPANYLIVDRFEPEKPNDRYLLTLEKLIEEKFVNLINS